MQAAIILGSATYAIQPTIRCLVILPATQPGDRSIEYCKAPQIHTVAVFRKAEAPVFGDMTLLQVINPRRDTGQRQS